MSASGLAGFLGHAWPITWRAARSSLLQHFLKKTNSLQRGKSESIKQPLKKPKLPEGRFDAPEDSYLENEPLEKFPEDVNPVIKEKGGPTVPEKQGDL
ncbi:succinate dehydrogenase assembly factor 4, mitochondrial [Echinops telfairi]|uniref:Succinate dehydrogenase assembly factor 4, mitochondrial n=1 Tax=Echinops telfairi TaxID=9371 RepID=A0ABM0J4G8_ECHTE|nr:succinate dehydrogenase assembly factor 4, mitochondrial [Echinops telfairi]